jgi:hypothetical protein
MNLRTTLLTASLGWALSFGAAAQTVTIGETAVLSAPDSGNGNLLLVQEAPLSQSATIQSMAFYATAAKGNLVLGVYDATGPSGGPGHLVAQTAEFKPEVGWNVAATTTTPTLVAGNYWLAYFPSSSALSFVKENNTGPCHYYSLKFISILPQTFSTKPQNCTPTNWSLYATLTSTATPMLSLADNPTNPSLMSSAAVGTVVTTLSANWSNGAKFTGNYSFATPYNNDGGLFALSGNQVVINGSLASLGSTTQNVSVEALQTSTASNIVNVPITITSSPTSGSTPTSGSDPTVGILSSASDGYANWSTAGLTSIGGIPNRTTIYTTISPNGTDDTDDINNALASCPAGQVVQLTAGVFKITGNGINFTTSNCTLRGAGPGSQLNTGINAVEPSTNNYQSSCSLQSPGTTYSVYCPDGTATQLIKADRNTNADYGIIYMNPPTESFGQSINLAADAVQGAYSITLASTPSTPINVGDIVLIDENTDNDPNVVYGPSFGPPGDGSRRWFSRQDRTLSQLMEVAAVNGNTITFDTPFTYPFHTAYAAQLTQYTVPFLRQAGVENLFVWGGMGGDYNGNIAMSNCAYCWVKNVEAMWSVGTDIGFYSTFRSVLRDSFIHETPNPDPGGGGYLSGINAGASENLFENNIMWYGNKVDVMRASGGGNVFAYNYTDDAFGSTYPDSPEAGANAGHYTTPHMELLEGNYSHNYKGDTYWGNSIYIAAFRNWFSALRAAHPPLKTYSIVTDCLHQYGDYTGRTAVDIQAYSFYHSLVGNVLGLNGQKLLTEPSGCDEGPETAFTPQVTTTTEWNTANDQNAVIMWQIGTYQATVNSTGNWSFVNSTVNTQLRNGNWDWATGTQDWYGLGGTTDGGATPVTLPNSFYLTSQPAFWPSGYAWPWVDPTTGTTNTLPAMYCFQQNKMPTCLQ